MAKKKYFKLSNEKASIFYDAATGLKVTKNLPGSVDAKKADNSKKIKVAVNNGHIKGIDEDEFKELGGVETKEEPKAPKEEAGLVIPDEITEDFLKSLKADELETVYAERYEVSEDDKKEFSGLNKKDKVAFILELEEDSE